MALLEKFLKFYHSECQKLIKILHLKVLRDKVQLLSESKEFDFNRPEAIDLDHFEYILDEKQKNQSSFANLPLTKRQTDIAYLLIQGKTNYEIAEALNLSRRTVEHYINAARDRLGISSKAELVIYLLNHLNS